MTTHEHAPHLLMFVLPLLVLGLFIWAEWRRTSERPGGPPPLPTSLRLMAAGMVAGAAVHAGVVRSHFAEAAPLGWFFVLLVAGGLAYVLVLVLAPVPAVVLVGVLANACVVALWLWTRSVGVPFGLAGGARELPQLADLVATGLELGCVLLGSMHLRQVGGLIRAPAGGGHSTSRGARWPIGAWWAATGRPSVGS